MVNKGLFHNSTQSPAAECIILAISITSPLSIYKATMLQTMLRYPKIRNSDKA